VCQEFEIETENSAIPQITFGFAGAIGITGAACGAVMAIGLKSGRADTIEESLRRFAVSREFRRRFEAEMGTINCRELTGVDLTAEGSGQLMNSDKAQTVCLPAVGVAYRLLVDLLKETSWLEGP
jgi:C_GCAxxG_C_C family probable redox protein